MYWYCLTELIQKTEIIYHCCNLGNINAIFILKTELFPYLVIGRGGLSQGPGGRQGPPNLQGAPRSIDSLSLIHI